ncbi:hypothetical protein C6P40_003688 [Pichia californica]|uniref:Protein-S-isoprenylcysteine O-methyltransferase n=1 Tax=Pichia californica TaxID=460514 RepID=A0A9P7BEQ8_9ASCO|nr:hypothetical protein C6P40_003688 [[Candida] californica]
MSSPSVKRNIDPKTLTTLQLNPLPEISATAYILGIVSGISIILSLPSNFSSLFDNFPFLPIYIFFISIFHFLEYFITASYQPLRVEASSFVLNNTIGYHIAHGFALIECILELYFLPNFKKNSNYLPIKLFGLFLIILGQSVRTLGMITAGGNFSHLIKNVKEDDHILIKHGIYSIFRHPSYFGFFWWAIGTQLLLLNPLASILFAFMLYSFFSSRIHFEERYLIKFFGDDYINYRHNTYIGIPFIKTK